MVQIDLFTRPPVSSQANKILEKLKSNPRGVANYDLADISLKYSSRLSELRKQGHVIAAERVYRNGKATGTYLYHLEKSVSYMNVTVTQKAIRWLEDGERL